MVWEVWANWQWRAICTVDGLSLASLWNLSRFQTSKGSSWTTYQTHLVKESQRESYEETSVKVMSMAKLPFSTVVLLKDSWLAWILAWTVSLPYKIWPRFLSEYHKSVVERLYPINLVTLWQRSYFHYLSTKCKCKWPLEIHLQDLKAMNQHFVLTAITSF